MEIRHLRYFCVLAEQLHFTKAAVLLNVAQPALSHQIKQLEDELGTQLVERTNRRVRLTEAGEIFLGRAARILEQIDQAVRETARVGQGDAGSLVIGVVSTAVCSILPELLRSFRRESPSIAIDIREMEPGEQVEALRKAQGDDRYRAAVLVDSRPGSRFRTGFAGTAHRGAAHGSSSGRGRESASSRSGDRDVPDPTPAAGSRLS